jgi:hypothetical protein
MPEAGLGAQTYLFAARHGPVRVKHMISRGKLRLRAIPLARPLNK